MADIQQKLTVLFESQNKTGKAFQDIRRDSERSLGAQGLTKHATAAKTALKGLAVAGIAAAGAALVGAIRTTANYEKAMSKVLAVTGASADEFNKLKVAARDMGSTTKFSASQAAEGLTFLGMAGLSVDQALTALPQTLSLAAAGGLELGAAADIATNIMSGMGLQAEDLEHVVNGLAVTASNSNTDVEGLGIAFSFAAAGAKAAGVDFDTASAAMGLMASAGIQGARSGTGLQAVLTRVLKPTKQARDVMDQYALSLTTAEGEAKPLVEIVAEMERAQLSAKDSLVLWGQVGGRAMSALVGAGSKQLADFTAKIKDSDGAAKTMATTMEDNLIGSTTRWKSAIEELEITMGEQLTPSLAVLVENVLIPFTGTLATVAGGFADITIAAKSFKSWLDTTGGSMSEWATSVQNSKIFAPASAFSGWIDGLMGINTEVTKVKSTITKTGKVVDTNLSSEAFSGKLKGTANVVKLELIDPLEEVGRKLRNIPLIADDELSEFEELVENVDLSDVPLELPLEPLDMDDIKQVLPKPDVFSGWVNGRFKNAFEDGLSTLIQTGDFKGFLGSIGQTIVGSVADGMASVITNALFNVFQKGINDMGPLNFGSIFSKLGIGGTKKAVASTVGKGTAVATGTAAGTVATGTGTVATGTAAGTVATGTGTVATGTGAGTVATGGGGAAGAGAAGVASVVIPVGIGAGILMTMGFGQMLFGRDETNRLQTGHKGTTSELGTDMLPETESQSGELGGGGPGGLGGGGSGGGGPAASKPSVSGKPVSRTSVINAVLARAKNKFGMNSPRYLKVARSLSGQMDFTQGLINQGTPQASIVSQLIGIARGDTGVPYFQAGGFVPGPQGAPALIMAHGGERITRASQAGGGQMDGATVIVVNAQMSAVNTRGMRELVEHELGDLIAERLRRDSEDGRTVIFDSGVSTPPLT